MKREYVFLCSMASFLISAVDAALITGISREAAPTLSNVLAAVFWLSMITGFVLCGILAGRSRLRKNLMPKIFHFFQTKTLKIIDAVLIASIICTSLCVVFHISVTVLWGLLLFLDIAAFEFHILFSIINKEKIKK